MIRGKFLTRLVLLGIVLAVLASIILFGRRLGLSEIIVVAMIVALILLINGAAFLIGQIAKGYRAGPPVKPIVRKRPEST